ncbi:MAG TPA: tetratricopeptide repeat protein [Chitinispirillaceae bacterium]|nr:tetratricopeptide repeat protein [Chitinispirillaceae bacterium]
MLNGITALKDAAKTHPQSAQIQFELGNAYRINGDFLNAAEAFRLAIVIKPDFFAAYFNMASALKLLGRFNEAKECLNKANRLQPDIIETYISMGNIHNITGDYRAAVQILEKAVAIKPDHIDIYTNLAESFTGLKDYNAAEQILKKALSIMPDSMAVLNSLGNILVLKNDLNSAKDYYCSALRIKPDFADAHYHLGIIMRRWNRLDEALICFKNALKFNPEDRSILTDCGECFLALGEIESASQIFQKILQKDPSDTAAADNLLLTMNYDPLCSKEQLSNAHKIFSVRNQPQIQNVFINRSQKKPLRIGYISSDFCKHPSATVLLPVFRYHNREEFQVFAYSQTVYDDEITSSFKNLAYRWQTIENLNDLEVCELIRNDGIDILVDCTGHMSGNRLGVFALRTAPLQVSAIGYPNTTGLQSMDYRLTDDITDPADENSCYSERLIRLSHGFCCYEPIYEMPHIAQLPFNESGVITFGSTHTLPRLNIQVIMLWSEVLKAVPGSRLLIFRNTLCKSVIERLTNWFTESGVDIARIGFQNKVPQGGHLAVYNSIDILLDTFPWSGHVTTCESLLMGVPVITLKGDRHAGRMVSSVLARTGLSGLIASTTVEYVNLAVNLASSIEMLAAYRLSLRKQVMDSPLCDCQGFVKCLEERYREIWDRGTSDG